MAQKGIQWTLCLEECLPAFATNLNTFITVKDVWRIRRKVLSQGHTENIQCCNQNWPGVKPVLFGLMPQYNVFSFTVFYIYRWHGSLIEIIWLFILTYVCFFSIIALMVCSTVCIIIVDLNAWNMLIFLRLWLYPSASMQQSLLNCSQSGS